MSALIKNSHKDDDRYIAKRMKYILKGGNSEGVKSEYDRLSKLNNGRALANKYLNDQAMIAIHGDNYKSKK